MSGSGGGGGYASDETPNCQLLSIQTSLASPIPAVVATLKIGDILDVVLTPPVGPVQVITKSGKVAGAIITPPNLAQLIQCITDGNTYSARVLEINGANCKVLIKHV